MVGSLTFLAPLVEIVSDSSPTITRRSTLQAVLASLGVSPFLSGSVTAGETASVSPDLDTTTGTTDAIVSLATSPLEKVDATTHSELSQSKLREAVHESQQPTVTTLADTDGVTVNRTFWIGNAVFVSIDTSTVDIKQDIAALSDVHSVYDNTAVAPPDPIDATPYETQPSQNHQTTYGLTQINAPAARDEFSIDGTDATVAVVDTGIDPDHPAHGSFDPNNFTEFTLMAEEVDTDPQDTDGHGTHVSGTAVGDRATDPSDDVEREIGVAPGAELLNAKVFSTFDGQTQATTAQVVAGIEWAVNNGADVINQSLGSVVEDASVYDDFYLQVLRDTLAAGVIPVAASGNNEQGLTGSPGNVREAFSIGATNQQRTVAGFSSGEQVYTEDAWGNDAPENYPTFYTIPDVAAPGVGVLSSLPGGSYGQLSGTSMSAPHVAGTVGLLVDALPDPTTDEIITAIEQAAVHPDGPTAEGTGFGVGIVDVLGGIAAATDDSVISGTVEIGQAGDTTPASGLEVTTDFGTRAVTGPEGTYELQVTAGEQTVQFDAFGVTSQSETVTATAGETETLDVSLSPELDVRLPVPPEQAQPVELARGESFTIPLEVANLETITIGFGPETTAIDPEDVTFRLAPLDAVFDVDETVTVDSLSEQVTLEVTVESSSVIAQYATSDGTVDSSGIQDAFGDWQAGLIDGGTLRDVFSTWQSGTTVETTDVNGVLDLEHTFTGVDESLTVTTGPTDVIAGTPASFEIVDATLPEVAGGEQDADDDPNTITVSARIENTGDVQGTQDVIYELGGFGFPEATTIAAGETTEFTTTLNGLVGAFGGSTVEHRIVTQADSVAGQLTIPNPAGGSDGEFLVTSVDAPESVTAGEELTVTATIENTRPTAYSSLVQYVFDERASDADTPITPDFRAVEIDGESTATVTLAVATDGLLAGTYTHSVQTATDDATAEIIIER